MGAQSSGFCDFGFQNLGVQAAGSRLGRAA